jgi:hypothetical protein
MVRHFPVREAAIGQGGTDMQSAGSKGRMGRLAAGPIGPKLRKNSFANNNLIFKYTNALEICRRRFKRNFDMRIFPKIF